MTAYQSVAVVFFPDGLMLISPDSMRISTMHGALLWLIIAILPSKINKSIVKVHEELCHHPHG